MLELRPNCERYDRDLPPHAEAYICSFECTWCATCAKGFGADGCPNCGGDVQRRPGRSGDALRRHPAGTRRVLASTS
ncbi:DUF1272 domain-containing protein [Microbacterium telephonicum]|uniref:DUF1272 domain-containing protein n=1 Tax=Microbacterium telephonicum TaxID=1714841 RepID=A0A498BU25_9MICO|nr:DUF1272 domain-containing protein [Microbacterium telephonicum]RLK47433.1 hypothetical protein C7474_2012 [Microbacterium telephonicum]